MNNQDDERRQVKLALRDPEVIKKAVRGAIEDQRRIMGLYIYPDSITNPSNLTNKLYIVPVVDILKFQWKDER